MEDYNRTVVNADGCTSCQESRTPTWLIAVVVPFILVVFAGIFCSVLCCRHHLKQKRKVQRELHSDSSAVQERTSQMERYSMHSERFYFPNTTEVPGGADADPPQNVAWAVSLSYSSVHVAPVRSALPEATSVATSELNVLGDEAEGVPTTGSLFSSAIRPSATYHSHPRSLTSTPMPSQAQSLISERVVGEEHCPSSDDEANPYGTATPYQLRRHPRPISNALPEVSKVQADDLDSSGTHSTAFGLSDAGNKRSC